MGCIDSFFLAHKGADGICRPFDLSPKTKKVDVTIKDDSRNRGNNYGYGNRKLFEILAETTKENKELLKKNYELQRELETANLNLKLKDKTLDNIKEVIDMTKEDEISDNFRKTVLLLINTAKS